MVMPRCEWQVTDEDCEVVWPTTASTPAGCCYGDSYKANAKCERAMSADKCADQGCNWLETENPEDCELTTTETPTTTIVPGCCDSDNAKKFDMCNAKESQDKGERSSSCHWNGGADAICAPPTTTIEPGCCYGNPDAAYSKRWMEACTGFFTERDCLLLNDGEGTNYCHWEALNEGYDCSLLWPTTTSTSTEPAGCCKGDSYMANPKCNRAMTSDKCENQGCEWIITEDLNDCVITTTTSTPTTTEPAGCCKGDSARSNDKCNLKDSSKMCDRSSSCHWIETDDFSVCEWEETTTEEPGCCYGNPDAAYSKRWMTACAAFYTERDCLLLANDDGENRCHWEPKGEEYDCSQLWPTTTSTTSEPAGCCYGDSYKANPKCARAMSSDKCADQGCNWMETEDPEDCELTTTKTPTTTEEPGCCYGNGVKENEMCATKDGRDQCERSGKCEFRSGKDADCTYTPTTTTVDPGCCYANTDLDFSPRWMDACVAFTSEKECLKLTTIVEGDMVMPRCEWQVTDEDCEVV